MPTGSTQRLFSSKIHDLKEVFKSTREYYRRAQILPFEVSEHMRIIDQDASKRNVILRRLISLVTSCGSHWCDPDCRGEEVSYAAATSRKNLCPVSRPPCKSLLGEERQKFCPPWRIFYWRGFSRRSQGTESFEILLHFRVALLDYSA